MSEPFYKLFMGRLTEAGYQLTQEKQAEIVAKMTQSFEAAGGKTLVFPAYRSQHTILMCPIP